MERYGLKSIKTHGESGSGPSLEDVDVQNKVNIIQERLRNVPLKLPYFTVLLLG
jgi:hypothetical protein